MTADANLPKLPNAAKRKLRRNPRRRWLGGVCAGIADYFGAPPAVVRLLFVLTFGISFWIYLLLWVLLPAAAEVPMPKVSFQLGRELRRIDRKVQDVRQRLETAAGDLAVEAFDALKLLAPYFERSDGTAVGAEVRDAGLVRLPKILDQLLAFRGQLAGGPVEALLGELADVRERLRRAASDAINKEFGGKTSGRASAELSAWRAELAPRRDRLALGASPTTLAALGHIEEKLAFLLDRAAETDQVLDLRPYEVRKIAFEYLPDALDQYLALPSSMARTQQLGSGKTAEESLNDQLSLLDTALNDLAKSLFEKDAGGLVVHGRFLKEKFAEQPFRLPQQ